MIEFAWRPACVAPSASSESRLARTSSPASPSSTDSFVQSVDKLRYLVDRRGIGAVFGTPGTGKSTLLRAFLDQLPKAAYSICYVSHSTCAVLDLFREIARGFAIEPRYRKADVIREVKQRIVKLVPRPEGPACADRR